MQSFSSVELKISALNHNMAKQQYSVIQPKAFCLPAFPHFNFIYGQLHSAAHIQPVNTVNKFAEVSAHCAVHEIQQSLSRQWA